MTCSGTELTSWLMDLVGPEQQHGQELPVPLHGLVTEHPTTGALQPSAR